MAGPRPKDQRPTQHIRVRFTITAIVTGARSLAEHFIRPVHPISRRPMSVNIFSAITAQGLSECWIPQQLRPLILSPAHQPVDIQVGADGSLYYLARGTGS